MSHLATALADRREASSHSMEGRSHGRFDDDRPSQDSHESYLSLGGNVETIQATLHESVASAQSVLAPSVVEDRGNLIAFREARDLAEVSRARDRSDLQVIGGEPLCKGRPYQSAEREDFDALGEFKHVKRFSLDLATVGSAAVALDHKRSELGTLVGAGEGLRQKAFSALFGAMGAGQRLTFVHSMHRDEQGRPCYAMRVMGEARHKCQEHALELAHELQSDLQIALAAGAPQFGFRKVANPLPQRTWSTTHARDLLCAGVMLEQGQRGRMGFSSDSADEIRVVLPFAPRTQQTFLDTLVTALLASPCEIELHIELSGAALDPNAMQTLSDAADALCSVDMGRVRVRGSGGGANTPLSEELTAIQSMLKGWSANRLGVTLKVGVYSDGRVPVALLNLLGAETLQGRPFAAQPVHPSSIGCRELDFSSLLPANAVVPALFPNPASLDKLGWPRHYSDVRLRTLPEGVVLGDISTPFADEVIRLADSDRSQHCYVIGSTGTGKSTLLRSLIGQDIEAGRGVAVLDPHGDLYTQVLEKVPEDRAQDVVLIDFTDFDHVPALNLLETNSTRKELERGFIIQELTSIFKRLYGNVPESMGPMFFLYMRNAVALAMEDPGRITTLLDVPRVFSEPTYRAYLLQNCRDSGVREFWQGIASPATGESSLSQIAPYITSKFTEFTQNELVRRVVGQPNSSIDFREIMDQRKILLVNLSKGLLSELDTRFLGMLLTGRVFAAAASRASLPPHERVPFNVYIDEFQNFTSESLSSILSESRKYGVAMMLAHQDLGQVPPELKGSLMTNTGSKIVFRVGAPDAEALAPYMAPHHSSQDLMTLPDQHAVTRIKVANVPSSPFVLRTRAIQDSFLTAAQTARVARMIEQSRRIYCTPVSVGRAAMEDCRNAYIPSLRIDGNFVDANSRSVLDEASIATMKDFFKLTSEEKAVQLSKLKSMVDRAKLQALLARMS